MSLDTNLHHPHSETPRDRTFPSRERFRSLVQPGVAVPVVRELDAPGLDPLVAFALLSEGASHAALLETSEAASGDADMSVVVPRAVNLLQGDDVLEQVRRATCDRVADVGTTLPLPRFIGGVVGMLGHEFATALEPRVPRSARKPPVVTPDDVFLVVDELVAFDHRANRVLAVVTPRIADGSDSAAIDGAYDDAVARIEAIEHALRRAAPAELTRPLASSRDDVVDPYDAVTPNIAAENFEATVLAARENVLSGECVQVVVSRRFDRAFTASPLLAYRAVRDVAPAPYHALLRLGDVTLVGASPEKLVSVKDERIVTHPIAGTRPRGADDAEDVRFAESLLADPKERAEHMMLVDLGRNDVARAATPGSVEVARLCEVERFSHVMHLVSSVEGELRAGLHPVDALAAAFPAGTLTGAPKVRAMELVAELEPEERGAYGGVVGYVGHGRVMDMAITIRTAVVGHGIASVQAGAGVVAASDPAAEEAETRHKARAVLTALALAERSSAATPTPLTLSLSKGPLSVSESSLSLSKGRSAKSEGSFDSVPPTNTVLDRPPCRRLFAQDERKGVRTMRVLLVDNYDSFTFNVADLLARLGAEVEVVRNDAESEVSLLARGHDAIVLSPGPGRPEGAGVSLALVRAALDRRIPLLGICLGMQCIGEALGATVVRLSRVVHGASSPVLHDGRGLFTGAPQGLAAGRYHSLVVDEATLPPELEASARTEDGVLMAVRHREAPIEGIQFHPESILTPGGPGLLARFLEEVQS